MSTSHLDRLSAAELEAEAGALLPDKEVLSVPLLDLNVDIDLALSLAAPIDLAVAANANAVLPIQGAVSADILTSGSSSGASAGQNVMLDQLLSGQAVAQGNQVADIDQTHDDLGTGGSDAGAASVTVSPFAAPVTAGDTIEPPATATATGDVAATDVPVDPNATLDDIDDTLNNVNDTLGNVNDTLGDVNGTLDDVDGTLDDVNGTLGGVNDTLGNVNGTLGGVNDVVGNLNDTLGNVNDTLDNVNDTLATLPGIIDPVNDTINNALSGGLLNANVHVGLDADLASPITGAVAANANVAAPVSAAVSANIGTVDSDSIALASQNAVLSQHLEDVTAQATTNQESSIDQ
jgi:archaellum component FlaC